MAVAVWVEQGVLRFQPMVVTRRSGTIALTATKTRALRQHHFGAERHARAQAEYFHLVTGFHGCFARAEIERIGDRLRAEFQQNVARQPRTTWPCSTIWSSTRFAVRTGIAKPMPCAPTSRSSIAVLMPTSWPSAFTSAPPELPELIAASVWMKSS